MDEHGRSPGILYLDGAKLRRLRIKAGLTQQELADAAGTTRTQVGHHEAGHWGCHMPQIRAYAKGIESAGVECKPADLMLDRVLAQAS